MSKLHGIIPAATAALMCVLFACAHKTSDVTIASVLQDWKTSKYNNVPDINSAKKDSAQARRELDDVLNVIDSSVDYLRLEEYVVKNVQSFDFVIRLAQDINGVLTERIDSILPDSMIYLGRMPHGNRVIVHWIIGTGPQEVRVIQFRNDADIQMQDTVIQYDAKSLLSGLEDAPSIILYEDSLAVTCLMSVWTPDVKRHIAISDFYMIRMGQHSRFQSPNADKVPQGMWNLGKLIINHSLPKGPGG